ncbi:MAG TPA: hypothetical protein VHA71_08925 [Rhodanobacteraceae bacterium]|nr:hypothetical protein [Rhodanobacteraceae bacterium]
MIAVSPDAANRPTASLMEHQDGLFLPAVVHDRCLCVRSINCNAFGTWSISTALPGLTFSESGWVAPEVRDAVQNLP